MNRGDVPDRHAGDGPGSPADAALRPSEPINPIVRFSVERRITMAMVVLGLGVLGWLSLSRLPLEFLPTFSSSSISVNVPYPSSSPEEVERELVRPLEDMLGTINGLDRMSASASEGSANLNLNFVDGTDMDLAAVEVRDRVDRARAMLPADLERVNIRRFQSTDIPVLRSNLSAPWPLEDLYDFVEYTLQPRLERLEGVAQVGVYGLRSRELQVELDPSRMAAAGMDVRRLATALRENHVNVSGGYLREGSRRLLVRSMGELQTLRQIRDLPIRADGLRLGDLAEVHLDFPERTGFSYLNGEESLFFSVNKVSTANLLQVVQRVKDEVEQLQEEHPELVVRHFHDASVDVRQGLSELSKAGFLGGGLAIVFMFFFLRKFRTTVLIAIAVPLSLIVTFVILYLGRQAGVTEMTLNVMSLMGLMLAVGMLLDNSIVVIESIFRHRIELGEDSKTAALRGASEVAMPIIASTATTMCVFLPLIFGQQGSGGGRGGGFMRYMTDIGTTVCVVMLASLFVSITVVPMVAAFLLKGEARTQPAYLRKMVDWYGAVIAFTLRHRLAFSLGIVLLLWGSWKLYTGIERTFSPPAEGRQITLMVDAAQQVSADEKSKLYQELYALLDGRRDEWEIADISFQYSTGSGRSRGRGFGGTNRFELYLTDEEHAVRRTSEIVDSIREALPVTAIASFKLQQAQHGPPGGGGIRVELAGDDIEILELLSPQIVARLEQIPFLKEVDSSLESGDRQIRVSVDRERALQAGLSTQQVAQTVSSALSSRALSYVQTEDREVPLVMQYRAEDRETLQQLERMAVFGANVPLPIGSLASFEVEEGARSIQRENRRPQIEISAATKGDVPSFAAMGAVQQALAGFALPAGYEWSFGRSMRDMQGEAGAARAAMFLAILLIYMIMAALFENFVQPFTIMLSIPFAFIGVGVLMKLAGQARSQAADMGLLILAGIVVNNAIVLIDHINRLRREGLSREEAVILGGKHRLRPILMTAVTTILGLSPMVAPFFLPSVFGQPEGRAAFWAPVGLVILGGLTTSTFLTLLVTPTIYTLVDDATRFFRRVARAA
ncbi:MAG TPA: efflux RND transporter permease subunit [Thermoanaerobaculia bacterium]|nr:efflux RND transporter permease subunit [Thermoanaerobaculia bacterium]